MSKLSFDHLLASPFNENLIARRRELPLDDMSGFVERGCKIQRNRAGRKFHFRRTDRQIAKAPAFVGMDEHFAEGRVPFA